MRMTWRPGRDGPTLYRYVQPERLARAAGASGVEPQSGVAHPRGEAGSATDLDPQPRRQGQAAAAD